MIKHRRLKHTAGWYILHCDYFYKQEGEHCWIRTYLLSTVMAVFGKSLSRKTKRSRNNWSDHKKSAMPIVGLKSER